jgi:hypothetical protein
VRRDGFFGHQFVAEHAGFFAPTRSQSAAAGSAAARRLARALYVLPAIASNLSGTARYLRFALCRQPNQPLRPARGSPGTFAVKTIHEVRQAADIDVRNPREYHTRTCNGYRLMFLVAWHLASVRHSMDHRRRRRRSARNPLFPGDDAAIGRLTVGKSDAAEQTLRHALLLLPNRQMSRSRQGQALLHRETR